MTTTTKDCPICMDSMTEIDLKHPMQCPGKCGFNFCVNCVEHLVNTSKMDYEEASDGSKQMKVKLTCPQVRQYIESTTRLFEIYNFLPLFFAIITRFLFLFMFQQLLLLFISAVPI